MTAAADEALMVNADRDVTHLPSGLCVPAEREREEAEGEREKRRRLTGSWRDRKLSSKTTTTPRSTMRGKNEVQKRYEGTKRQRLQASEPRPVSQSEAKTEEIKYGEVVTHSSGGKALIYSPCLFWVIFCGCVRLY